MSVWLYLDTDSAAYMQKMIIDTDIPDDAKRKVLESLDLKQPDNGMRLTLDIQYKFDANIEHTAAYSFGFMTFLRGAIRDYQNKYEQPMIDDRYANKAIKDIAQVDLLDIEYCDAWVSGEDGDG